MPSNRQQSNKIMKVDELTLGLVLKNNKGCKFEIIRKIDKFRFLVHFFDPECWIVGSYTSIFNQTIVNRNESMVCGIGYISTSEDAPLDFSNRNVSNALRIWERMIKRCYSGEDRYKYWRGVEVCNEWHDFSNFLSWHLKQFHNNSSWCLDKDLLARGKKVYSPNTCVYLPKIINTLLTKSYIWESCRYDDNSAKIVYQLHEQTEIAKSKLSPIAYKMLSRIIKGYMKEFKNSKGQDLIDYVNLLNKNKTTINLSNISLICLIDYKNNLIRFNNFQQLQDFIDKTKKELKEKQLSGRRA